LNCKNIKDIINYEINLREKIMNVNFYLDKRMNEFEFILIRLAKKIFIFFIKKTVFHNIIDLG